MKLLYQFCTRNNVCKNIRNSTIISPFYYFYSKKADKIKNLVSEKNPSPQQKHLSK